MTATITRPVTPTAAPVSVVRRNQPGVSFAVGWAIWALTAALTLAVPDKLDAADPRYVGIGFAGWTVFLAGWAVAGYFHFNAAAALRKWQPWIIVLGLWTLFWEWSTAKTAWLIPPHFASPQHLLSAGVSDFGLLVSSTYHSLLLLLIGFGIGSVAGFATGLAMGWSKVASYWGNPFLQFIGPVPAATLLPLVLVLAPTTYSGSVFMVAFGVWFPVAVLTRAGIAGVARGYFDVAQTLGASPSFLVWRIAVPGALPSIFTGLFMGLGASLAALAVAELLGVKNGLGWYIQWTKGWAAYPRMYVAILIMVVVCRVLMLVLFRVRNRALAWQKDLVRW
ncbi:ABC transporter permease [Nocardia camponoti]|uniref:ABC transporter permease n=1 Tax=Nocardia camponoti TaxID=1616106 RepID=A0A917Q7P1_9NOCA|nr:ABC transporter permease subunit [Nocardia camponoti]GGK34093.1 ABC transporter permease [Nocardia camponoti]